MIWRLLKLSSGKGDGGRFRLIHPTSSRVDSNPFPEGVDLLLEHRPDTCPVRGVANTEVQFELCDGY